MGGVAGHLAHLYDNRDITFNEMKKILSLASQGNLVGTEKTDGYNIFLGFKDNLPRYARNKGDMKSGGMTSKDLAVREFKGGPEVKKVYIDAFRAYEKAVRSLTRPEQDALFGPSGHIFYNTEIQGPGASNLVNYDANVVSIHHVGHKWLNPETDKLEVIDVTEQSKKLDNLIQRFEQATSEEPFSVRRTAVLQLQKLDGDHDLNIVLNKIQKAGFTGTMTIEEFLENYVRSVIDRKLSYLNGVTREQMVDRILDKRDESGKPLATLTQIHKGFPIEQKKVITDAVKLGPQMIKEAIWPIEDAIHDFAVELLRGLKSAYILDNEAEVKRLKKEVDEAIKAIQKYQGPGKNEAHEILAKQLEKIKSHKNVNTAVEGFVFQHGDQMYKFTGNFAPANQILGLFRYGRGGIKIPKDESKQVMGETGILNEEESKIIALIPGKFKPPHRGHLDMVKHYAELADVVKIMISPLPRDNITWEDSKAVWEIFIEDSQEDLSNVVVMKSPKTSPVGASFDYVENKNSDPELGQDGEQVILGTSTKGGDQSRFAGDVQRYADRNPMGTVQILNPMKYVFDPIPPELHASHFRDAIAVGEDITPWLPEESHGSTDQIIYILSPGTEKKTLSLESLFSLVEQLIDEKQLLKEADEETAKALGGISDTEKKLGDLKAKSAEAAEKLAKSKEAAADAAKSAIDVHNKRKDMLAQRRKSFEEISAAEEAIIGSEEAITKASQMKQKAIKAKVKAAKTAQAAAEEAIKLQNPAIKAEEDKQSSMQDLQDAYEESAKVDQDLQSAYEESGEAMTGASDAFDAASKETPAAAPGDEETPAAAPGDEEEEAGLIPAEKEKEEKEEKEAATQKLDKLAQTQQGMQAQAQEKEEEVEAEREAAEKPVEETSSGAGGSVAGAPGMGKRDEETLIR